MIASAGNGLGCSFHLIPNGLLLKWHEPAAQAAKPAKPKKTKVGPKGSFRSSRKWMAQTDMDELIAAQEMMLDAIFSHAEGTVQ